MSLDAATLFIEWVYANPGLPATDYAIKLAEEMEEMLAAEREACAKIAMNLGLAPSAFMTPPESKWAVASKVAQSIAAAIRARK